MAKNALKASKSRSDVILRSNSASESLMCFQSAAFDKFRFKVDFNNTTKKREYIWGVDFSPRILSSHKSYSESWFHYISNSKSSDHKVKHGLKMSGYCGDITLTKMLAKQRKI